MTRHYCRLEYPKKPRAFAFSGVGHSPSLACKCPQQSRMRGDLWSLQSPNASILGGGKTASTMVGGAL